MARKRKNPRPANEIGIVPLHYDKRDFEENQKTAIDFAEAISHRNRDLSARELSRSEVASQYVMVVLQEYSTEEPKSFELLGQLDSPAFNTYWAKVTKDESTLQPKREIGETSFRIMTRRLPAVLTAQYPHCVVLHSKTLGSVVVPNISLREIQQISFKEVVRMVLDANTTIDTLPAYVQQIWVAIIRGVYHFEDAAHQASKLEEMETPDPEVDDLLESYHRSHPNPDPQNSHKRSAVEELERDQDDKKSDDEGKRERGQKEDTERNEWQELEEELESALADTTTASVPAPYNFSDTPLQLRFKKRCI